MNGGASWYSPSIADLDIASQGGSLGFKPNWLLGSQATLWMPGFLAVPRFGLRLNLNYTDTDLRQLVANGARLRLHDHINLWSTTGDLMFYRQSPGGTGTGSVPGRSNFFLSNETTPMAQRRVLSNDR